METGDIKQELQKTIAVMTLIGLTIHLLRASTEIASLSSVPETDRVELCYYLQSAILAIDSLLTKDHKAAGCEIPQSHIEDMDKMRVLVKISKSILTREERI